MLPLKMPKDSEAANSKDLDLDFGLKEIKSNQNPNLK
jgi:hypothetical protein